MKVVDLKLKGLKCIYPKQIQDERGVFIENYQRNRYSDLGAPSFVQDNLVCSKKNSLRGMHFQSDPGQDKLITVVKGKIYDVAIDIRPSSDTFGQHLAMYLDDRERAQFFIPHGFAHGYCVLSDEALVYYKVSALYNANTEMGFRFDDPDLQIQWPIEDPILSLRDRQSPRFKEVHFAQWFS